ncbi:hypothetical protein AAG570_009032 [Ranatra chinensis]|uniref:RNA-directed DNA polymerase n=1 Tax=Ranatra chinensis TaxID=642074 RepID=A0ABD0YSR6_9HEMI
MINDKPRQLILEEDTGTGVTIEHTCYGRTQTWKVAVGQTVANDDLLTELLTVMRDGTVYPVCVDTEQVPERFGRLYVTDRLGDTTWKGALIKVQTVTDKVEQDNITKEYHVEKTINRGIIETLKHLRRQYYWVAMPKTLAWVIAQCKPCVETKYEMRPEENPQMLTSTPSGPLEVVETDVIFWIGQKVLSVIDRLTRFAFSHLLSDKTSGKVSEGLLAFFGTVGPPGILIIDQGREIRNARVTALLKV